MTQLTDLEQCAYTDLFQRVLVQQQLGNLTQARQLCEQLFEIKAADAQALHLLGIILGQQGQSDAAIEKLNQALLLEPKSAAIYSHLGNVYRGLGNIPQASEYYHQAIHLNPDYAEAYNNLANIAYTQQDLSTALKYYAKAVNLSPDLADAHFNLGMVFIKQHQLEAAEKQFHNVVALNPAHFHAYYYLGFLYFQREAIDEAIAAFKEVIKLNKMHLDAHNNLGAAYLKTGNYLEAIKSFATALRINEDHLEARSNLANTLLQQDRYQEASWNYEELLKRNPDDWEAHYNLGVALMPLGKFTEAQTHLQQILTVQPGNVHALINLAAAYLNQGKNKLAVAYYQAALHLQPDNTAIAYILDALAGKTVAQAPADYVKNLFDGYASHFDEHVAQALQYQVPELIKKALEPLIKSEQTNLAICDLGCGTGLSGAVLKDWAGYLVGIDLSPKMIKVAAQKNIYDKLITDDLVNGLTTAVMQFDIIVAADVLVYIGDLHAVFHRVTQSLKPDGYFIFSVEQAGKGEYQLQSTARYAHSKKYLQKIAQETDMKMISCQKKILRQQQDKEINGYIVVLGKK